MKKIFLIFIFFCLSFADNKEIANALNKNIQELNSIISTSIWNIKYENFIKYQQTKEELEILNFELKKDNLTTTQKELINRKISSLKDQMSLLKDYKDLNFIKLLTSPDKVSNLDKLTNPFLIISALSYIKKIKDEKNEQKNKINEFNFLVEKLQEKNKKIKELVRIQPTIKNIQNLKKSDKKLEEFNQVLQLAFVSYSVYEKMVDDEILRINEEIKAQTIRLISILVVILLIFILSFALKYIIKKYIKENERYYTANKIINFVNISFIFLILLFSYIENISYLVTVLGFASAGIAIAMKDMFMSMLGWVVIILGGSLRVGDRIKVFQNDTTYIGDIIDISFLRITMYEDITLNTYLQTRRSGRIVFIPNNYIFTNLISNYTHHGVSTVWDGLDITISFDSNYQKAMQIVEQIVLKNAKANTELARKNMYKLRNEYSIKNPKVDPRFFMFFESYGMRISAWYMTNSYAALLLRSNISQEIINEFNKHEDIKISYPSQNIYLAKNEKIDFIKGQD